MNHKRTFLDSVNAGRRRRPTTSLAELNRTLDDLEGRLGRFPKEDRTADHEERWREDPQRRRPAEALPYRHLADDMRHARMREDDFSTVRGIASELRELREEMRQRMDTGLEREFSALRDELERHVTSGSTNAHAAALGKEFERLSSMINAIAERTDDRGVDVLRQEMGDIRRSLDSLAREDTVRSVGQRWDEFDRRWDELATDLRSVSTTHADEPAFEALQHRLSQIEQAVHALPESLSLGRLEDKLRTLAGVVDNLGRQQGAIGPDALEIIEQRLDELSRAVVASASGPRPQPFDTEPLERIEARIGALARQVEEVAGSGLAREIGEHIDRISQRVDELAHRVELPENAVEGLARQIDVISQKLDTVPTAPDLEPVFRDMEGRFATLSERLDQRHGDAVQQGQTLFRELERRLEEIAAQAQQPTGQPADSELVEAMEHRFSELARHLEERTRHSNESILAGLERRLEEMSSRLEAARHVAQIDPGLIESLRTQVTQLSEHMARPERPLPEFEDLAPRLDHIERSIEETRERLLEAARKAAEEAVRTLGADQDAALAKELASEVRGLEQITRSSDERNAKTFAAIHDTLIKIVDRLGSMETAGAPAAKRETIHSPSIAPEMEASGSAAAESPAPTVPSPVEAASAAAQAAQEDERDEDTGEKGAQSLFGGLARAFRSRRVSHALAEPESSRVEPAEIDVDEPLDPQLANEPLEPGSGAPDLNAIMRRVRDQRGEGRAEDRDTARSDFIAAARRAAQAAAAEAGESRGVAAGAGSSTGSRLGRFLPKSRKTLLTGVALLLILTGGFQLSRIYLSDAPAPRGAPAALNDRDEGTAELAEAAPPAPTVRNVDAPAQQAAPTDSASRTAPRAPTGGGSAPATIGEARPIGPTLTTGAIVASGRGEAQRMADTADAAADQSDGPFLPVAVFEVPAEAGPVALREAAELGDPAALYEVGNRYAEGRGVDIDMRKAAEWYELAAEGGLAPAQYRLANLYEKGIGVDRDIDAAKTWYQLAAAQGNASAMHNLGVLFAMGADGVTDNDSAARWFEEAAELGVQDSQFNMGILSARGIGIPQNLEEAYKWFSIVAEAGDGDAAEKREGVAAALSSDQLEKAKVAAELWRPRSLDPDANMVDLPDEWSESETTTASFDLSEAVADMQRILNAAGYNAGPVDGLMGQQTRAAIMAFQRDNEMEQTGEIDEKLVRALLESL